MKSKDEFQTGGATGLTDTVVAALRRIIRAIDLRSRHLVTQCGVTGPQLTVLKELSANSGCCVGELTRAIHVSQATATGILDRLVKRELVRRKRSDGDKRRVLVWLTPAGEQLLADAPPLLKEEFTAEFRKLADWEQTQILSSLQRVVVMMEAKGLDVTPMLTTGPIAASSERTKAFLGGTPQAAKPAESSPAAPAPSQSGKGRHSAPQSTREGREAP